MRPKKCIATPASTILDPEPSTMCSDNQPPPHPPPAPPPLVESDQAPRRAIVSQKPSSLVVRNTRKSRNKPFYTPIPRSNHYLLARSLVEDVQQPMPLVPGRKSSTTHKTQPSQFCVLPSDFTVSEFIWRFSAPDQDSQVYDAFAALRSSDPQTFSDLIAGFD